MSLLTLFNFPPSGQPTSFADDLNAAMDPWITPDLETYNAAVAAMFQPVADLVYPIGNDGDQGYVPPWGKLFDPDLCPSAYLGYLGQFVGVTIPAGTPDSTARQLIRDEPGFKRGTTGAIIAAVKRTLAGTQTVYLAERTALNGAADAYQIVIVLKPSEVFGAGQPTWATATGTWSQQTSTWGGQMTVIQNAVNAVKPAGIVVNYALTDGFVFANALHTFAGDTFTFTQASFTQP